MSGPDESMQRFTTLLTSFGEAIGTMRQRMISSGVPDRVADQVLCEVAREFTRAWNRPRYDLGRRSGQSRSAAGDL